MDCILDGYFYYCGNIDKKLNILKQNFGILLCKYNFIEDGYESQFKYYNNRTNKDVYSSSNNRKNIVLSYYYYNVNNNNIVELKHLNNTHYLKKRRFSQKFFNKNFKKSTDLGDVYSLSRNLKLQKIINKINEQSKSRCF